MRLLGAVIGWAAMLLAASEYIFVNEGPALSLVRERDVAVLAEMLMWYLPPAFLAVALLPQMSSRPRAILAGALVGWSIEAAVVPAAYEAPPVSYFWTSVAWHAVVTVGVFGIWLPGALGSRRALLVAICLGGLSGLWATWTWGEFRFTPMEYGALIAFAAALWSFGAVVRAEMREVPRWFISLALAINGALWLVHAAAAPLAAAGLLIIALPVVWALGRAPRGSLSIRPVGPGQAVWMAALAASAVVVHEALRLTGFAPPPDLLPGSAFLAGMAAFAVAFGQAVRARDAPRRSSPRKRR